MKKTALALGIVVAFMLSTGVIFKMQHWPGGSVFLIFGVMIFSGVFLPLHLIYLMMQKESPATLKAGQIAGTFGGIIFAVSVLFKMQHWPGASAMILLAYFLLFIVFLPLYIIGLYQNRNSANNPHSLTLLTAASFGILLLGAALIKPSSRTLVDAIIIHNNLESSLKNLKAANNTAYLRIDQKLAEDDKQFTPVFQKCIKVKFVSSELCKYLAHIRAEIKMHSQPMSEAEADSFPIQNIDRLDDYDMPTHFLVGSDPHHITGESRQLKDDLDKFRLTLMELSDNKLEVVPDTRVFPLAQDGIDSWETSNFYHTTVAGALLNLMALEIQVKTSEGNVLAYLLENAEKKKN